MKNKKIERELLTKYLSQEKELLDFIKSNKEAFERVLNKVKIYDYLGYYVVEFYIEQNSYYDLFEQIMKEIYSSNHTEEYQNHLFDCLNKLESISIDFEATEKEMSVEDIYRSGYEEWDFEITSLKPLEYIFDNCNRIED